MPLEQSFTKKLTNGERSNRQVVLSLLHWAIYRIDPLLYLDLQLFPFLRSSRRMTRTRGSRAGGRSSSGQTATWVTSASGARRSRSWWSCPPGCGWSAPATCSVTSATRSSGWTQYSCTSRWAFDIILLTLKAARFISCWEQYDIVSSKTNLHLLSRSDPLSYWFLLLLDNNWWSPDLTHTMRHWIVRFVYSLCLSCLHCNVYDETLLVENPTRILLQNLFLIFGIHFEFEFASNFENGPEFVFTVLYLAKWHNWFA